MSPTQINMKQNNAAKEQRKCADAKSSHPGQGIREHDTVTSRITGKKIEIGLGPNSGNLVPANPFASLAQEGFLHAHPEKLGKEGLAEWDSATKGKKLPEHVRKKK